LFVEVILSWLLKLQNSVARVPQARRILFRQEPLRLVQRAPDDDLASDHSGEVQSAVRHFGQHIE
jgi:uncharacterized membrane protein YecN with MAPEG domain